MYRIMCVCMYESIYVCLHMYVQELAFGIIENFCGSML
jgi:hypothetical protein